MSRPRSRLATQREAAMLRRVVAGYRRAGLRVPPCVLRIVSHHPRWEGWATPGVVHVVEGHLTLELLVHEVAHLIADQLTEHPAVHGHNRFWALVYGIGYQQVIQR